MESILSLHDEVYSLKSRRRKSSAYFSSTTNIKRKSFDHQSNISCVLYQSMRTMISQRSVYILGILNLILAVIAIICVAQAEDHPEYFSLVYIAISIFVFYMGTIVFIIVLQIIETYQEQTKKPQSSSLLSVETSLLPSQIHIQSNPILVQNTSKNTKAKTRLFRSQTLPLTASSADLQQNLPTITSSPTLNDFNQLNSTCSVLLPKHQQLPKNYQTFALTTHDQFYPSYTTITNSDSSLQLSSVIKPIPLKYSCNSDDHRSKVKFSEYE